MLDYIMLVFVVFILCVAGVVIHLLLGMRRVRNMARKKQEYDTVLQRARNIREYYLKAVEAGEQCGARIIHLENELKKEKSNLVYLRKRLRESLREIRDLLAAAGSDELLQRTAAQRKVKFGQEWRMFSSLKNRHNETLEALMNTRAEAEEQQENINARNGEWSEARDRLMELYSEIKRDVSVPHPHAALSAL